MKRPAALVLFALALANFEASTLQAATLNITSVDWQRFAAVDLRVDGQDRQSYAGVIQATYDGGPSFDLFCIDLFTSISYGVWDSYTISPRSAFHEERAAWLYANVYTPATINTPELGAALQIAFWDIVHDGGDGVDQGRIQRSASTSITLVNSWQQFLAASLGQTSQNASIYINSRGNTPAQSLIGLRQGGNTPAAENVPEPGTFALLGGALVFGAWRARRAASRR